MSVFKLPDLGEGLSEAEILRWHVKVGDHIEVDAPLLSVETAKAVVEVPSPMSGRITRLHAAPGDRLEIGAPLVEFATDTPTPDSGTVVGHMPVASAEDVNSAALNAAHAALAARVRAVPAARALARSLGVELTGLTGTGRNGLITLDDVMAVGLPARTAGSKMHPAAPRRSPDETGDVEVLRSLRRTMAQSMALSRDSVMECSVFDDADLHAWSARSDYTGRVLRAITAGVGAEPVLNAWFDAQSQSRTLFEHIDVGIAVDTSDGLLVPVIRQVQKRTPSQLREDLDRLKRAARDRTIGGEELRNFTFMLSNFGTMAGRYATPVVVPPAVAILGTGRVRPDVVAVGDRIEIHLRMPLSLTFDHRVVTGGEAVRFLAAVIADLEQPE
ncbi:MAG TPA: dihydrolipoamide acetyltransferase family protein [Steroidobacteraceae bacterium]|nr:dihydrolipoamide acetyltransferase family protein [Steroidobacteraceae bacterium]